VRDPALHLLMAATFLGPVDTARAAQSRRAEERIPGCVVSYGWVSSPRGYRVRTVLTRPEQATGRLPTIVFIPWLSCDRVEGAAHPDGWLQLLYGLAQKSGWAVYRVEKPGVGDSEGPPCSSNDLETDLAAFRAALDQVQRMPGVDTSRIVLFGGSIGGALAPILARERHVAGVIAAGGFSRTWFEHMIEIERTRLTFEGRTASETNEAMRAFSQFYALVLDEQLTPAQAIARHPELGRFWYDAPDGQYGRPAAYYHQVARLDVEGAWESLTVPALILHGEYDWIMSAAEADHAQMLMNAHRGRRAERIELPRTDHNFGVYASRLEAYRGRGGSFDPSVVAQVTEWLRRTFPGAAD
jgi:pimeloyl-ACP methyl ester carboxylesterase